MLFISIVLPVAFSFMVIHLLWPSEKGNKTLWAIKLFLSTGLGLGVSSLSYYVLSILSGSFNHSSIRFETIIFIVLILIGMLALGLLKKKQGHLENRQNFIGTTDNRFFTWHNIPVLTISFWTVLICSILTFIMRTLNNPHGGWDAWAIWNLRARFLFRGQEKWMEAFSSNMRSCPHVDYPLLIPASVARIWSYIGTDSLFVPAMIAFLFTVSTAGLIVSSLIYLKGRNQGYLSGVLLLAISFFTIHGASQYSDLPFGFFVLSTLVLLLLKDRYSGNASGLLFLSGMMAGLSAWTKNEGLLFILVVLFSHLWVTVVKKGWAVYFKEVVPLLTGVFSIIIIVVHFKMRINMPNDIVSNRSIESLVQPLIDYKRYMLIGKAALYHLSKKFLVVIIFFPIMLILFKISIQDAYKTSMTVLFSTAFLLLSGYFFIYLITPNDLTWHLRTSLSRLYLQVMPSIIFLFFASLNAIDDQEGLSKPGLGRQ